MTAVKRAWRGRGIAKSLKLAEITWAQANGIERLTTTNEERNAPMLRINASLGYRPAPGRVLLRGPATHRDHQHGRDDRARQAEREVD